MNDFHDSEKVFPKEREAMDIVTAAAFAIVFGLAVAALAALAYVGLVG